MNVLTSTKHQFIPNHPNKVVESQLKPWFRNWASLLWVALVLLLFQFTGHHALALKGNDNSHDPSGLVKDGNKYWQFTTGDGIYAAYSTDLISWTAGPNTVFPVGTWPSWINSAVPGFNGTFWAPDVIYMNGLYHLYYSVSTFGSSRSAIGLVTNPTLDPNNPNYQWTDRGMVVSSNGSSGAYNAIDPGLFRDSDGRVYMTYGSFFGGLVVVEIDTATGKVRSGSPTVKLAGGNQSDWEAPYIIKEGSYYYFFANRGKCCQGVNSTYKIVMGRSTSVWGPYYDMNGVDLNYGGGTLALGSSGRYHGPGHFGLLRENGSNFVSIHYYDLDDNGNAKLDILNMGFSNGWPFLTRDWLASGQYSVRNNRSGKYMDPWGCTGNRGEIIAQGDGYNSYCQRWNFSPLGNGVYRITTPLNGRVLDVNNCNPDNGASLALWDWLNNNCQKFKIERASDGNHVLTSLTGNRVIEVPGGSTTTGTQLKLWDYNGRTHQKWTINWVGSNTTSNMAEKLSQLELYTGSEEKDSEITLYPNPSHDGSFKLNIGELFSDKEFEIVIRDTRGRMLYREPGKGSGVVSLNLGLKSGMYLLFIRCEGASISQKLLVN